MKVCTEKLRKYCKVMEQEQYSSRDNRINGKYWKHCVTVFRETENLLKALMGVWRYPRAYTDRWEEIYNFPEISRVATVYDGSNIYYIGEDIRLKITTRTSTLHGKKVVCLSGFFLQHSFQNMENSWSNPIVAGEYADESYRPVEPKNK